MNFFRTPIQSLLIVAFALSLSACRISKNFHEVKEGELYRSAQLTEAEFDEAITQLGIRTVINLRGPNPGADWYEAEKRSTSRNGVEQIDIGMGAKRYPHRDDLLKLLDAFKNAKRPILIHCRAGADRTGEAVALYRMEYLDVPKAKALDSLTFYYYHIAAVAPAKRDFVKLYQGEEWARESYFPCRDKYKYYPQDSNCPAQGPTAEDDADSSLDNSLSP